MRVEEFRDRLLEQRRRVLARIDRLEAQIPEQREAVDVEMEERAQGDLAEHVLLELDERSRDELYAIGAALDRIRRGEYGRCEVCGGEIPEARLRASPTAAVHVECAERREPTEGEAAERRT
jgi:DnaK suppressor protein